MICEFLFFDENSEKKEKVNYIDLKIQIRELLKNQFEREVLTAVLMDLRKDVTGKTREDIYHMYQDLDLHKDAYKNLKSWRWEKVSKGIFELTQMEVKDAYGLITRFINDKRSTIRKQAEIATVSLKDEGINYFLDHTRFKISEWQQLKLLDVVRNKKDYVPPPFRLWLTSKNNHVVLFSLRLIKYYNQNDASASLIQLLRHTNNHIKKEAIFCIRDFNVTDAVPVLKQIFWKCTTDTKMHVLEALSHLGTEKDIGFIENIVEKEMAFTVKGKAITALNTIRPEGVLPTQDIQPKEDFTDCVPDNITQVSETQNEVASTEHIGVDLPFDVHTNAEPIIDNTVATDKTSVKITPEEISFLPIVTDEEPDSNVSDTNEKELPIPVNEINVYFEEVPSLVAPETLHANFLPIVIPKESEKIADTYNELLVVFEEVIAKPQNQNNHVLTKKPITEIKVDYEEFTSNNLAKSEQRPLKPIETQKRNSQRPSKLSPLIFSDQIALKTMIDLPVVYQVLRPNSKEKSIEMLKSKEVDWSTAFIDNDDKEPTKNEQMFGQYKHKVSEKFVISKPNFYNQKTLETVVLLENIAEFGDHREIPLLQELLQQENPNAVVDIILTLLKGFTKLDENQELLDFSVHETRQSVFENLLKDKNDELKIVLLNEIAAVGDQQEIRLLKELVQHDNKEIRKAAEYALEQVQLRSFKNKEEYFQEPSIESDTVSNKDTSLRDSTDLLDIALEVNLPEHQDLTNTRKPTERSYGNTLFDHLCAHSSKLYNKEE